MGLENINNAYIDPNNTWVQPPEVFEGVMELWLISLLGNSPPASGLNLSGMGITAIRGAYIAGWALSAKILTGVAISVLLNDNKLSTVEVDFIILELNAANNHNDIDNGQLDLSGPDMGTPTGGLTNPNLVALGAAGWTGFVSISGVKTAFP